MLDKPGRSSCHTQHLRPGHVCERNSTQFLQWQPTAAWCKANVVMQPTYSQKKEPAINEHETTRVGKSNDVVAFSRILPNSFDQPGLSRSLSVASSHCALVLPFSTACALIAESWGSILTIFDWGTVKSQRGYSVAREDEECWRKEMEIHKKKGFLLIFWALFRVFGDNEGSSVTLLYDFIRFSITTTPKFCRISAIIHRCIRVFIGPCFIDSFLRVTC